MAAGAKWAQGDQTEISPWKKWGTFPTCLFFPGDLAGWKRAPHVFQQRGWEIMEFIEMSGKALLRIVRHGDTGLAPEDLCAVGVNGDSLIRVNRQGDIEIRRADDWDVIGGLLGDFEKRIRRETGLGWA